MLCSSTVMQRQIVGRSVCPSVTLRYDYRIGWNTSKIISRLISLGFSLSLINIISLLQREYRDILAGVGVWYGKIAFGVNRKRCEYNTKVHCVSKNAPNLKQYSSKL